MMFCVFNVENFEKISVLRRFRRFLLTKLEKVCLGMF